MKLHRLFFICYITIPPTVRIFRRQRKLNGRHLRLITWPNFIFFNGIIECYWDVLWHVSCPPLNWKRCQWTFVSLKVNRGLFCRKKFFVGLHNIQMYPWKASIVIDKVISFLKWKYCVIRKILHNFANNKNKLHALNKHKLNWHRRQRDATNGFLPLIPQAQANIQWSEIMFTSIFQREVTKQN